MERNTAKLISHISFGTDSEAIRDEWPHTAQNE